MNQADTHGCIPVWIASGRDHLTVVKVLVASGGLVNRVSMNGYTSPYVANQEGYRN